MNTIAFFNNEHSIDKTSLIYHVTYMLAELGHRVLVVDLDPQPQLTTMFLKVEKLQEIYESNYDKPTIIRSVHHLDQKGGIPQSAHIHELGDKIGLIAGDPELAVFEDKFSSSWAKRYSNKGFRHTVLFYDIIKEASDRFNANYTIVNLGSDFSAINRAALIALQNLILPISANIFSLSNIQNIGKQIKLWDEEKLKLLNYSHYNQKYFNFSVWIGYVFMQHSLSEEAPPKHIPYYYQSQVINLPNPSESPVFSLSTIRYYHGLHTMSKEHRKPIFSLKPADGVTGSQFNAVRIAYKEYKTLTENIIKQINIYTPSNKITI